MAKKIIWCGVTCGCCGEMAGESGYYSPALIRKLKEATKDWKENKEYRVLCPDCQKKLSHEN